MNDETKGLAHLVNCFGEMEEKLRKQYNLDPKGLTEAIAEQHRLQGAFFFYADLLKKTGFEEKIWRSIFNHALGLLKPAKAGRGRPVDGGTVYMVRANLVVGLECLIHAGMEELDAARYIARKYPAFKRLLVERKPRKRTTDPIGKLDYLAGPIIAWANSFRDGTVKDVDARRFFTKGHPAFVERFRRLGAKGCKTYADELLSAAARQAKALVVPDKISEWSKIPASELKGH